MPHKFKKDTFFLQALGDPRQPMLPGQMAATLTLAGIDKDAIQVGVGICVTVCACAVVVVAAAAGGSGGSGGGGG